MDEIETPIIESVIENEQIVEDTVIVPVVLPKMPKKEKPRTTPIRSSSSTPNMKKVELVKLPPFNPISPMMSPKIEIRVKEMDEIDTEVLKIPQVKDIVQDIIDISKPTVKEPSASKESKTLKSVDLGNKNVKLVKNESVKNGSAMPAKDNIKENIKIIENTLSSIRSKIPKYSEMTQEEQNRCRETFRNRFNILRDTWKTLDIPKIKDSMSLEEIHETYEVYIKNIHVGQSTDKYKVYMVIMWLFIEYGCIQIGLNVSGYTMSQMKSMSKYERLLIELGEKNYKYSPVGDANSDWPVEFNILFMALANAAIFIIIKMLCEKINMGDGIANTIIETMSSYLSGAQPQPGNVLFGGNHHDVSDVPAPNNAMGGLDLPSIISGLGNMFLQGQGSKPVVEPQGKTPKFKPVYDE